MGNWQTFLIGFGIFNLCLLIFCRSLSALVLGLFAIGRRICPPENVEKQSGKIGFQGIFSDEAFFNSTRKQVTQFLAWTGGINFVGCVGLYLWISSGFFDANNTEQVESGKVIPCALLQSHLPHP